MSTWQGNVLRGTRAAQPAAAAVVVGAVYCVTDEGNILERSTGAAWESYSPDAGGGDVVGPASSTDNAVARWDGATGALLQDTSALTLSDTGVFTFPDNLRQTFNPGADQAGLNVGSIAGDPGTPTNGDVWYDSTANELTARINGANVVLGAASVSTVVQVVNTQTGAVATGTTVIPADDTIPQQTEGTEFMTLAITPTDATNNLQIEVVCFLSVDPGTRNIVAALFQDATADALAVADQATANAGFIQAISFTHVMTAGTTSATTFKVRAGVETSGTVTFNGSAGARFYGGVLASSITITEYVP